MVRSLVAVVALAVLIAGAAAAPTLGPLDPYRLRLSHWVLTVADRGLALASGIGASVWRGSAAAVEAANIPGAVEAAKPLRAALDGVLGRSAPAPEAGLVFFALNDAGLDAKARAAIDGLAAEIERLKPSKVVVAGHADRAGTEAHNRGLSERRARAARAALVEAGVAPAAIETVAFGEARPLVPTPEGEREPRNRRVEITLER